MSDAVETKSLTGDDVTKLISRSETTDPGSTGISIFQGLGENAILSGDVLRLSLSPSLVFEGPLSDVLTAVGSVTKTGSLIVVTNGSCAQHSTGLHYGSSKQ